MPCGRSAAVRYALQPRQPPRWMSLMSRNSTFDSCGRGFCRIRSGRRTRVSGTGKSFQIRAKWLQCKNKERKLNTKKCLITIVSVLLMTAVMHAQEASDLTAEKQLAQRKAELDAREKALNEREKTLAEKERATANSTRRSREKAGAKARQQQAKAQSKEEQAKAEVIARKMHEPFWKRLDEAMLEQLSTPAYTPPAPSATPAPTTRRIPPAPFDSPLFR